MADNNALYSYFQAVAGADGTISAGELKQCLHSAGWAMYNPDQTYQTCQILIRMCDREGTGKMDFKGFKEVWEIIQAYKSNFNQYDRDRSGLIEPHEFFNAMKSRGYTITPGLLQQLVLKYGKGGCMNIDGYIIASTVLQYVSNAFQRKDPKNTGYAYHTFDELVYLMILA